MVCDIIAGIFWRKTGVYRFANGSHNRHRAVEVFKINHICTGIQLRHGILLFPALFFLYFLYHAAFAKTVHGNGTFLVLAITHIPSGVQVIVQYDKGIAEGLRKHRNQQQ